MTLQAIAGAPLESYKAGDEIQGFFILGIDPFSRRGIPVSAMRSLARVVAGLIQLREVLPNGQVRPFPSDTRLSRSAA